MEEYKKDTNINTDMVKLKCKRCDYEWEYNGDSEWYASCPKCRTTVNVRKQKEEVSKTKPKKEKI